MSKKHYEAIASLLKQRRDNEAGSRAQGAGTRAAVATIDAVALDLAGYFAADNQRFDKSRFLKACGVVS